MIAIALLLVRMLCDCFKSRSRLEAEIVVLRHQLNVLRLAMLLHIRSLAGYTIDMIESSFWKRQVRTVGERERVIASTDCGFGTFTNREWVIEPAVWLKLRSIREGADIASARLWGKKVA
jgi:hypothetical protein